jgi:hypothetical protein
MMPAVGLSMGYEDVIRVVSATRAHGCRVVLATRGQHHLKEVGKRVAIQAYCQQHGFAAFADIGDGMVDLPIWQQGAHVYVVLPTPT